MKATRRQELKTNELAQTLEEIRNFLRSYGNYVLLGVICIAVIAVVWVYMKRSSAEALATANQEMNSLTADNDEAAQAAITKLTQLGAESSDEAFICETLRMRASVAMERAHAHETGEPSAEFLDAAQAAYDELLRRFPEQATAVGAALCGLATIEEDRFILDGDLSRKDKARGFLERVRDNSALTGHPIQTVALDRLNKLDETFVQVTLAPPIIPQITPVTQPGGVIGPMGATPDNPIPVEVGETVRTNIADLQPDAASPEDDAAESPSGAPEETTPDGAEQAP